MLTMPKLVTPQTDAAAYLYEVRLRPGCYSGPDAPLISRHRSLRAAVAKARRSDRWQVELSTRRGRIWAPPERRSRYGAGLFGSGPQPGEPSLDECVRQAERATYCHTKDSGESNDTKQDPNAAPRAASPAPRVVDQNRDLL